MTRENRWIVGIALLFLGHQSFAQHSFQISGNAKNGDIIAARVEDKLYVRDTLFGSTSELKNGLYTLVRDTVSLFDFVVFNSNVEVNYNEGKL